jgi:hypothetical protein
MANIHDIVARYIEPNSDAFKPAMMAVRDALDEATPRVAFLTPAELERADHIDGLGSISFERARRGRLLTWGSADGDTIAIVVEETGAVYSIAPHLIKFL